MVRAIVIAGWRISASPLPCAVTDSKAETNFSQSVRLTVAQQGFPLRNLLFSNKPGIDAPAAGYFFGYIELNALGSLAEAQRHCCKIANHRIR